MNTEQLTQITFTSDPKLKELTLKKAKKDGITLKSLFIMSMKAYLDDKLQVTLHPKNDYYDDIFADKDIIAKSNQLGEKLKKLNL